MSPVALEQEQVATHDSAFTRGHHVGYALAMAHIGHAFLRWMPMSHLAAVRLAVAPFGARVSVVRVQRPNHFSVRFVHVRVDFPAT